MNNKPIKNPFWYVFGPLLVYWIVGICVSIGTACVLVIGNVDEFAKVLSGIDTGSADAMTMAMQQCSLLALKLELKYALEIQCVKAICSIFACSVFYFKDRKREKEENAQMPEKATWSKYIFLLVFAVAYNVGVSCLSYMVQVVSGNSSFQNTSAIFYNSKFWLQIVGLSILVPIMEELLFRGIIYKRMRTKTPFLRAAMFSAILFSFMHSNAIQMVNALVLGLVLAYVYDKYGSFKAPVFTHMIANLTAVIGTNTGIFNGFAKSPEILGVTVVICTFVAAVMFTMIQKMDTGLKPEQPSDKSDDSQKPNLDMFR